jgi:hypothetical protein
MKNSIIIIALFLSFTCLGQSKLTPESYKKISADFNTNPAESIEKNATKDYIFITGIGTKYSKDQLVAAIKAGYATLEIATQEVAIQQSGNTAIVTGAFVQEDSYKQSPNIINIHKGLFTYVYFYERNSWKLASSHHSDVFPSPTESEAAIKKVIVDETQAYIDGDGKKLLSFWADKKNNESASQYLMPILGQPYAKGESMEKLQTVVVPNLKKQDFKVEREDFEIRINKNMAWATYTQKAIANGKTLQTDRETRILERINGDWKIVYVGEQGVK